jgi:hypothetical protein
MEKIQIRVQNPDMTILRGFWTGLRSALSPPGVSSGQIKWGSSDSGAKDED